MVYINYIGGHMDIKQCRYFISIVENGNISQASKVLHIAQPPLSMSMKQLEEELNCTLFIRGSRSISLTDAGKIFYSRAKLIVNQLTQIKNDLSGLDTDFEGVIRLGVMSSATSIIMKPIEAFQKEHPGVTFEIYEANTYQLLNALLLETIELALVRTPYHNKQLESKVITEESMCILTTKEFTKSFVKTIDSFQLLADQPLIIYRRWETIIKNNFEILGVHPHIVLKCDDARTAVFAAQAGIGMAIIPEIIAEKYTNDTLKIIRFTKSIFSSEIHLLKKKEISLSNAVAQFYNQFNI